MQIAFASLLIGNSTSAFADSQLQNESKFLNNRNYFEANCSLNKAAFKNCLNVKNSYSPKDKLDEYIIKGATYSTKFVPLMNDATEGIEVELVVKSDPSNPSASGGGYLIMGWDNGDGNGFDLRGFGSAPFKPRFTTF